MDNNRQNHKQNSKPQKTDKNHKETFQNEVKKIKRIIKAMKEQ